MAEDLPKTMSAVAISAPGGPDVLGDGSARIAGTRPGGSAGPGRHAGVNRPDCLQRAGSYPPPKGASPICRAGDFRRGRRAGRRRGPVRAGQEGLRAGERRRLCRILHRPARTLPARARRAFDGRGRGDARNAVHRVAQRVPARLGPRWGDAARPRRHDRASARWRSMLAKLFGMTVITTCGSRREMRRSARGRRRPCDQLQDAGFRRGSAGPSPTAGASNWCSTWSRAITRSAISMPGRRRPAGDDRGAGRAEGRNQHGQDDGAPPDDDRLDAARRAAMRSRHAGGRAVPRSLAAGRKRGTAPGHGRDLPLAEAAAAHARMEAGEHVGKIVLEVAGTTV